MLSAQRWHYSSNFPEKNFAVHSKILIFWNYKLILHSSLEMCCARAAISTCARKPCKLRSIRNFSLFVCRKRSLFLRLMHETQKKMCTLCCRRSAICTFDDRCLFVFFFVVVTIVSPTTGIIFNMFFFYVLFYFDRPLTTQHGRTIH